MFTGIVEAIGKIESVETVSGGKRFCIDLGEAAEGVRAGDSVCVDGACLTANDALKGSKAVFDVTAETLRVSTLGGFKAGQKVNLERALVASDRFGGHMVQGHVDGVGKVEKIDRGGDEYIVWVSAEPELMRLMIVKGSVAVDGVSLTIAAVEQKRFSLAIIPTTLAETTLETWRVGDKVNLEADLISKWINKRLDEVLSGSKKAGRMTLEKLRDQGFT